MRISTPWLMCSSLSHPPRGVCQFLSTYETQDWQGDGSDEWSSKCMATDIQYTYKHRSTHTHTPTCMSPQAFPWSPQPLFNPAPLPPRVSLEMMPATTAGSTPCLLATLVILSLYWFTWGRSLDAIWRDAATPALKRKLAAVYLVCSSVTCLVCWCR